MCRISSKKTMENIKKIMGCLHDSVLLFKTEERIQLEKITEDIKGNSDKANKWIDENAKDFRDYLEKIEHLARKYKNNPERMHELSYEIDTLKQELN
jgi:hypothetical protein